MPKQSAMENMHTQKDGGINWRKDRKENSLEKADC